MKLTLQNAIACPKCFAKLNFDEKNQVLVCLTDHLIYPVRDGIPVLLESEAQFDPSIASTTESSADA